MNGNIRINATEAEHRATFGVVSTASLESPPTDREWERCRDAVMSRFSLSAWDGDVCVGGIAETAVETMVPGGALLPSGLVNGVGVLPTARHRSVERVLVERLVCDSTGRGHALMSLRPSDAVLYSRYGFGVAGDTAGVEVDATSARPVVARDVSGRMQLLDPGDVLKVVPELYERVGLRRAGAITRTTDMWNGYLLDAIDGVDGSYVAVHHDESGYVNGYVHYDVRWADGPTSGPRGEGIVHELCGDDARVELALWSYLLSLELVTVWRSDGRPVDDVARLGFNDPRAYRQLTRRDEQWLRIVDIDVALPGRSYQPVDRAVVIQVTDPLISANTGTWRVDGHGAFRSHEQPQLLVEIDALSAAYLGGTAWWMLEANGRVRQRNAGAIEAADMLFASVPAPFRGSSF